MWKIIVSQYLSNQLFIKIEFNVFFFFFKSCKKLCFALLCLYPHYICPHNPQILRSVFQRENSRKYTWELKIVIPTNIYTFPYDFPQLLPLHLYIVERLLAQTLITPILSVKWDFGVIGKHWKKPFIGRCNRTELQDPEY